MKIRLDFVTNSSSSGYVVIQLNFKNGKSVKVERDYDSGYGGYLWNGGDFESAFEEAETGEDILAALQNNVNGFEFVSYADNYAELSGELKKIKS